jgi:hypothetical protein
MFVEMTVWRRSKVCFEVRVCTKCLDSSVEYDPAHSDSCQVVVNSKANKKKSKYTCSMDRCFRSCWVCSVHKIDKKTVLEKIRTQQKTMKAKGLSMKFAVKKSMISADTDVKPERRYYKFVPFKGGQDQVLNQGLRLKKKTKVGNYDGNLENSDHEDIVGTKMCKVVYKNENQKFSKVQTKYVGNQQTLE